MTNQTKLHEIVAIRKGVKARTYGAFTALYRSAENAGLFNGMYKEFKPVEEGTETFPPEAKKVQAIARDLLRGAAKLRTEFFDVEITKDAGNQHAMADIVVDGVTLAENVPVMFLITLEKDLKDLRTFVKTIPTLDDTKDWESDPNSHTFRTEPTLTHKTKKVQKPIVLYPHSEEHPAQTQLVSEDVIIGHWHTKYTSGALPVPEKEALLERLDKLRDAVKKGMTQANDVPVDKRDVGGALFGYLLG
jgi:hypothetical protein